MTSPADLPENIANTAEAPSEATPVYDYSPPVDRLLIYGDCRHIRKDPDYVEELGFTADHIPDLIRMATDEALLWADSDGMEVWAPVHAWRSLGQFRAEEAIEPLIPLFHRLEDDDWVPTELPKVFGSIGAAAIPALADYLAHFSRGYFSRVVALDALQEIAKQHPETRQDCIDVLAQQLDQFQKNHPTLNGFLINTLIDLKAVETSPVMEQAFAAKRVDTTIMGDWQEAQVLLGLKTRQEIRQERSAVWDQLDRLSTRKSAVKATPKKGFAASKEDASAKKSSLKKRK